MELSEEKLKKNRADVALVLIEKIIKWTAETSAVDTLNTDIPASLAKDLQRSEDIHKELKQNKIQSTGEMLRRKRRALDLTQRQVAEKAKITLPQYQKFEKGTRDVLNASFDLACRVVEALDMDISTFYREARLYRGREQSND